MPRVPSFNMDDHRPVFDAQAVLDHESPNAADPPRPMPAGGTEAADDRASGSTGSSLLCVALGQGLAGGVGPVALPGTHVKVSAHLRRAWDVEH